MIGDTIGTLKSNMRCSNGVYIESNTGHQFSQHNYVT